MVSKILSWIEGGVASGLMDVEGELENAREEGGEEEEDDDDGGEVEEQEFAARVEKLHRARLPLIDLRRRLCSNALAGVKGPKPPHCRGYVTKAEPVEVVECPGCLAEAQRVEDRAVRPIGWGEDMQTSGDPAAGALHMVPSALGNKVRFAPSPERSKPLVPSSRKTLTTLAGSSLGAASASISQGPQQQQPAEPVFDLGLTDLGMLDEEALALLSSQQPRASFPQPAAGGPQAPPSSCLPRASLPHLPPIQKTKTKIANIIPKSAQKPKSGQKTAPKAARN